jgi:hypothetical protein
MRAWELNRLPAAASGLHTWNQLERAHIASAPAGASYSKGVNLWQLEGRPTHRVAARGAGLPRCRSCLLPRPRGWQSARRCSRPERYDDGRQVAPLRISRCGAHASTAFKFASRVLHFAAQAHCKVEVGYDGCCACLVQREYVSACPYRVACDFANVSSQRQLLRGRMCRVHSTAQPSLMMAVKRY